MDVYIFEFFSNTLFVRYFVTVILSIQFYFTRQNVNPFDFRLGKKTRSKKNRYFQCKKFLSFIFIGYNFKLFDFISSRHTNPSNAQRVLY